MYRSTPNQSRYLKFFPMSHLKHNDNFRLDDPERPGLTETKHGTGFVSSPNSQTRRRLKKRTIHPRRQCQYRDNKGKDIGLFVYVTNKPKLAKIEEIEAERGKEGNSNRFTQSSKKKTEPQIRPTM